MATTEEIPIKKGSKALLLSMVLLVVGVAAGFGAVASGVLDHSADTSDHLESHALPEITYVEVPLIVASLPDGRHLRFGAQIEAVPSGVDTVNFLMPRIQDIMNEYLRTIQIEDVEAPGGLMMIRAHLLRRLQVVIGTEAFRDLMVTEFVLD